MKKIFLILFLFILFSSPHSQWISLSSPCKVTLRSVSFINSEVGWICGDSGIILKTINGGLSWDLKQIDILHNFSSICFTDSLFGWAVGYESDPHNTTGIIYNTTNGGGDWIKQFIPDLGFAKIRFTDRNNGWTNGYFGTYRTTNFGQDWILVDSLGFILDVFNYDVNIIWVLERHLGPIGTFGEWGILNTMNGTKTWDGPLYPAYYEEWPDQGSLFFLDSKIGWAAVWFVNKGFPLENRIYKTNDGGKTWNKQISFLETISDIQFVDSLTGWITTESFMCSGDTTFSIYNTTDGGKSWKGQGKLYQCGIYLNTSNFLTAIQMIDENLGYAVGYGGSILKTINGGTPVVEKNISPPKKFYLSQNYPNPFNPGTTIRFQIPLGGYVSLKVYDVIGKEVATLVNEYKQAGSYKIEFNTSRGEVTLPLPSGIYFYQLIAGDYIETKKLVLMK